MASDRVQAGVYFIQNFSTGTVMDLSGAGNPVTPIHCRAKRELTDLQCPAQLWLISPVPAEDNVYIIENANYRSVLDLDNGLSQDGTQILGHTYHGGKNQQWRIIRHSNNMAYLIQNVKAGTYSDLSRGSDDNGTKVVSWSGNGNLTTNHNQLWLIVRA